MRTTKELTDMLDVITEAMYGGASQEPDGVDFAWWNDEQLHDFISKRENITNLNEDDFEALVMEVVKRVGAVIEDEDAERPSSSD